MSRMMTTMAAALALCAGTALVDARAAGPLSVKTTGVTVFKDGYCMFVKEATGETDESGKAVIDKVPPAMVLGSFWVTPETGKLASVIARQTIIPKQGRQETEKSLLLSFDTAAAGRKVKVNLIYFGPGIRWIPTYRIVLNKDSRADLIMQAEILNEAEDLTGAEMRLVVGVPNFRFKNVVSPMSLEATLQNALQRVAPQIMGQLGSNVLFSQRAGEMRGRSRPSTARSGTGVPAVPPELIRGGAQDLFVYKVPGLALRAGQRAIVPLVSTKVPFRHLYTWGVRLRRSGTEAAPTGGQHSSPVKLLKNEVWHLVELTNGTNVPWTTGAALLMDGPLPLAQELLTYTSITGKCQVPVTVAVDVRGTYAEEETGRELKAIRFDGYHYTHIAKKGTLRVTNYKREPVALLITCQFGGNAAQASDKGRIVVTDYQSDDWSQQRGHPALNGHSTIHWDLTVKPGETKEVTCEYSYYLR